jgi:hypothetical protein
MAAQEVCYSASFVSTLVGFLRAKSGNYASKKQPSKMNNSEPRLTEVEMQLMLLQRQVDQLSQELYRSALSQEKLLKRVEELEKQRAESESTDVIE